MRRIVIVGNSLASAKVATRVKRNDPSIEVNIIIPAQVEPCGDDGAFSHTLASRRAVDEMLKMRDIGVVEADDISIDFDAKTVYPSSSRGRIAIRYNELVLSIDAQPRIPRLLRKCNNVFSWPSAFAQPIDSLLAGDEEVRAVVIGQNEAALEALKLIAQSGQVPVWIRIQDNASDMLDAEMWRSLVQLAEKQGIEVYDWTHIPLEHIGTQLLDDGLLGSVVALDEQVVEGQVFLWTAPCMVQHPVVAQEGISLDAQGRIVVDSSLRAALDGVFILGTGVSVESEGTHYAVSSADVSGLARTLADILTLDTLNEGNKLTACLSSLRACYAEGAGFAMSRAGCTLAEALRNEADMEFALMPLDVPHRRKTEGVLKLIADKATGILMGFQATGAHNTLECITPLLSYAITQKARVADLAVMGIPSAGGAIVRKAAGILVNKLSARAYGITGEELIASREAGAEFFVLDLRSLPEWREGHIATAYNIPFSQLAKRLQDEVPRYTPLVLVSRTSDAAWCVACKLLGLGATALYVLDGGMECWEYERERA